jgi:hypothetical protein
MSHSSSFERTFWILDCTSVLLQPSFHLAQSIYRILIPVQRKQHRIQTTTIYKTKSYITGCLLAFKITYKKNIGVNIGAVNRSHEILSLYFLIWERGQMLKNSIIVIPLKSGQSSSGCRIIHVKVKHENAVPCWTQTLRGTCRLGESRFRSDNI